MEQQQVEEAYEVPRLELQKIDGFNGKVIHGLKVHPDRQHIIYPLGCAVVIEDISGKGRPCLLWGHTDEVTCITISNKSGHLIASGQKTYMGFKAITIVWDYASQSRLYTLELHKVNIQALDFSPNDLYLASLGGCDDGCVVVWDMATGNAICGSPAQVESAGNTLCVKFSNQSDDLFVTGGDATLRVWKLNVADRKIRPEDVNLGQNKRKFLCICISMDDSFFYCGTETGDIFAINMKTKIFQFCAPEKKQLFEMGVTALAQLKNCNFLVGTGCGKLVELKFPLPGEGSKKQVKPKQVRSWKDETNSHDRDNAITSIALRGNGHQFFVGTKHANMYKFGYECSTKGGEPSFDSCELIKTCHDNEVKDVIFPPGTSELIVTCQREQIRIWALKTMKELKRQTVANMTCNAVALACHGTAIVSAWDDGIIRIYGFGGASGNDIKLKMKINAAHSKGVSSIACTQNPSHYSQGEWDFKIVSGGGEGQVRIWHVWWDGRGDPCYELEHTLKEHKGSVSDIKIRKDDKECISSSTDGTCIIWNLEKKSRSQIVFANTLFKCVSYNKEESQIITSGTDRKIGYWECFDGSTIRSVEGSMTGSINAMDMSPDGRYFVTGGDDKLIKVWTYDGAEVLAVGQGHSGKITRIRICPQQKYICSVSEDGGILVWKFPY